MRCSVHLCVYMYSVYGMYVSMHMCTHMSVCACVGQQSRSGVFFSLSCSSPYFLGHCFSLSLKLAGLAMLAAIELQGVASVCFPQHGASPIFNIYAAFAFCDAVKFDLFF